MFKNMLIGGGGDPEGIGYFRSLSGSKTGLPANLNTTVSCGFVPRVIISVGINQASPANQRVLFIWTGGSTGICMLAGIGSSTSGYAKLDAPVTVNGTTVTFNLGNWESSAGSGATFKCDYTIYGTVES